MDGMMSGYGLRVRDQRERLGLSQPELSDRTQIPQQEISRIESGKIKKINLEVVLKLAKLFSVPPGWLLFGVDNIDTLSKESFRIAAAWDNAPKEVKLDVVMRLFQLPPATEKENAS